MLLQKPHQEVDKYECSQSQLVRAIIRESVRPIFFGGLRIKVLLNVTQPVMLICCVPSPHTSCFVELCIFTSENKCHSRGDGGWLGHF